MTAPKLTPIAPARLLVSRKEAAACLSISLSTLARNMESGVIPFVKIGKSIRIRIADLEGYCDARKTLGR